MTDPPLLRRFVSVTLGVVTVASFSLLAVLSFVGLFVRPSADDWCVLWKTRDLGILGITKDYYLTQNGRISNAFVSGLVSIDGMNGMRILPGLLVAAFGIGLVLLLRAIWRMLGWQAPFLAFVTVAVVIELALLAGAHDPYEALLWAPGSITHTLPSIIAVWAVYLGVSAGGSRRRWVRAVSVTGALLVGLFLGMLAEPSLVMLGLLAGGAGMLFVARRRAARTWYPVLWCTAACIGLVLGFAVLYTSPGAQSRRGQNKPLSSMLSRTTLSDAAGDWLRIMDIVTSQWVYLAVLAVGVLAGVVTAGPAALSHRPPRALIAAALILVAPLLLAGSYVVVLGVRQGYGNTGWRDSRVWFNFIAPMALAVCAYGVLLGRGLRHLSASRSAAVSAGIVAVTALLAGAFLLVCADSLVTVVEAQADFTITRARAFDAQDARIRAQVANGATEVVYRPIPVPGLAEPNLRPGHPNFSDTGASAYYRVHRLLPPPKPGSK